jgi:hypothetical protein
VLTHQVNIMTTETKETKSCPFCGEDILVVAIKCKHCGSILTGAPAEQEQPEQILSDAGANMFRGIESVGGRMKITTRRVLFESHAINLQKMPAEISITDIAEVGKRNTLGLIPNGLFIRTKTGVEYKFVVFGRDKLIRIIQDQLMKRKP